MLILLLCSGGDLHSLALVNKRVSELTSDRRRKIAVLRYPPFCVSNPVTTSYLCLDGNQIGDLGMVAFSEALGSGSLRSLTDSSSTTIR